MKAANKSGTAVVVVVGSGELESGKWTVKSMQSGEQESIPDSELEARLGEILGEIQAEIQGK